MASAINHNRARVASLTRSRTPDDPELIAAKTALKTANIAEFIERALAAAPPLTDDQRRTLANLLQGGATA